MNEIIWCNDCESSRDTKIRWCPTCSKDGKDRYDIRFNSTAGQYYIHDRWSTSRVIIEELCDMANMANRNMQAGEKMARIDELELKLENSNTDRWLYCFTCGSSHYHVKQYLDKWRCPNCHSIRSGEITLDKEPVILTTEDITRQDEVWASWFKCPTCGDDRILNSYKFCPMCGVPIVFQRRHADKKEE